MIGVSDVQMESMVSSSFADVNEAFDNSEIGIDFTIVNQTRVRLRSLSQPCLTRFINKYFVCVSRMYFVLQEDRYKSCRFRGARRPRHVPAARVQLLCTPKPSRPPENTFAPTPLPAVEDAIDPPRTPRPLPSTPVPLSRLASPATLRGRKRGLRREA